MRPLTNYATVASALFLAGCLGDSGNSPLQPGRPAFVISDGARSGNPEFFFLPPMVGNPNQHPNWTRGGFNAALRPSASVCALELPATAPESAVLVGTPCRPGGYLVTFPFVTDGDGVRLHPSYDEDGANDGDGGHYHVNWRVPVSSDVYFRIRFFVDTKLLGFADVHSVASGAELKNVNTGEFIARKDGTTVPIKVRIENRALCDDPGGTSPCTSASVSLGAGGTVSLVTDPLAAPSGVVIPPQSGQTQTVTVTVQGCPSLNPRVIDLPTFGSCLRINTLPVLAQPLVDPATVFVCDYPPDLSSLTHAQGERVTLHRLKANAVVEALPHAPAACPTPSASIGDRLNGMVRYLASRRWRAAGEQLAGLIGPAPLHAIDRGGGGRTLGFSDFQFALPGKLEIVSGNGQAAPSGTTLAVNPTVKVTDIAGDPVAGATVRFAGTGSVGSPVVVTDAAGMAFTNWTVVTGANQLSASGRGIAGTDFNGPRPGVDPFMSIQDPFDPGVLSPLNPVDLLTGSVTFAATGIAPASLPMGPLATNYFYKVVAFGADPTFPAGGLAGFSLGNAGFGTANSGCDLNASVATNWPLNTDILVKKAFTVPAAAAIRIGIAIDNDVRVFLDGVEITSTSQPFPEGGLVDGYLRHEGCPSANTWVFTRNVTAGVHELAIRGRDRGGQAYLDVSVTLPQ